MFCNIFISIPSIESAPGINISEVRDIDGSRLFFFRVSFFYLARLRIASKECVREKKESKVLECSDRSQLTRLKDAVSSNYPFLFTMEIGST